MIWFRRGLVLVILAALVAGAAWSFQPQPILVDVDQVSTGALEVTINEDGKTRIKEKYIVSTPVAGRLQRIEFREGDLVVSGETVVASIQPSNPSLLDARTLAQAEARKAAAEASQGRAKARYDQAVIDAGQAKTEFDEANELLQNNAIAKSAYDLAYSNLKSWGERVEAAEFDLAIAKHELDLAKSALELYLPDKDGEQASARKSAFFTLRSPINGVVLRILQESSTIVTPGTPIMELGDAKDLEIVVDLLSSDAVKVGPGTRVKIEQWGGKEPLTGVVRLVEPSAFLKISALGVEEQRVNVIVDFELPDESLGRIGDGYRVEAKMVTWQSDETLKVKTSALFRERNQWAVFVLEDQRAKLTFVKIGHRNDHEAEIIDGLSKGQQVVLHPGDSLSDGSPAAIREAGE